MFRSILFFVLFSIGLSTEWGTSFSVRTPNDNSKPLDYELSIKFDDSDGDLNYLIKRDWERELGEKYIDDVLNFTHKVRYLYYGVDYVNKESKDINYTTYNLGAYWPEYGLSGGVSIKDKIPMISLGFNKKMSIKDLDGKDDIEYNIGISVKSDVNENNIFNIKSEVKKWLTERVNIFGLYKHEYYNEKEDFQFKVGIGIKL